MHDDGTFLLRTRPAPCPECGAPLVRYYVPGPDGDGDAEPAAHCSNRRCTFRY